jgi:hypothetical protein
MNGTKAEAEGDRKYYVTTDPCYDTSCSLNTGRTIRFVCPVYTSVK